MFLSNVRLQYTASSLAWDIALAIILALGVVFTADSQKTDHTRADGERASSPVKETKTERSNWFNAQCGWLACAIARLRAVCLD
jgi:hypothetical protein